MCDKPDKNAGTYAEIIDKTAAMVLGLDEARKLAGQRGLFIQDVTWEDSGRYKKTVSCYLCAIRFKGGMYPPFC